MTLQERHDLANDLLVSPTRRDPLRALGTDTLDFEHPVGDLLNNLKHLLIEGPH